MVESQVSQHLEGSHAPLLELRGMMASLEGELKRQAHRRSMNELLRPSAGRRRAAKPYSSPSRHLLVGVEKPLEMPESESEEPVTFLHKNEFTGYQGPKIWLGDANFKNS